MILAVGGTVHMYDEMEEHRIPIWINQKGVEMVEDHFQPDLCEI